MQHTGVLRKIHGSRLFKATALVLLAEIGIQLLRPPFLMALTSGPSQPETEAFQPIGITDMVDPFTGDFSYNIPLLNVGDYPINLAYQSGVTMDEEASWTGLGWNVHTGAITRQMRGLPDDFWGDQITRRVHLRNNVTVGAKAMVGLENFGLDLSDKLKLGVGIDIFYNNYNGLGLSASTTAGLGIGGEGAKSPLNLGLSLSAGPDGLDVSPNLSFTAFVGGKQKDMSGSGSLGFGFSMNSRAGLGGMSFSHSATLTGNEKIEKESTKNTGKKPEYTYTGKSNTTSPFEGGSSIRFGQPTFTPQIELPMNNFAVSGRFKLGGGVFGQDFDGTVVGYGSRQSLAKNVLVHPAYGYMYAEKGNGNGNALHDFNREKDGSFTIEKKNLPLTNFTHDIFSIAAQGLGGSFRAYRNDVGYVYDNYVMSPSTSTDLGVELAPGNLVDLGVDITNNVLESESGAWTGSNAAAQKLRFRSNAPNDIKENFHLKMTGEKAVDSDPLFYGRIKGDNPVRFELDNDSKNFETAAYNQFVDASGNKQNFDLPHRGNRQRRNTAVYQFTKAEILQSYPYKAKYLSPHAKNHHIAEIVVVQPDGKRYVFGLAAYNSKQVEISFNAGTGGKESAFSRNAATGLVDYVSQSNIAAGTKRGTDHYYDETETPAYAHSWMLTEILSPDYIDITGDGPTADDFGTYVKFNYGNGDATPDVAGYKWRTPTTGGAHAAFMEGLKSDQTDDKANLIYGEKDIWYVRSIESKSQIAVFETEDRLDGLGALPEGQNDPTRPLKRLKSIKLYAKQEWDASSGSPAPVPVKTVHFEYDYLLCPGTPNSIAPGKRKLTLTKVFFTYRGSETGRYSPYEFRYRRLDRNNNEFSYRFGRVDRWNTLRQQVPVNGITSTGSEFPYADQDRARRDDESAAWHLEKIALPSGGTIDIKYESDDYAFVQDKAAMRMFKVHDMGRTESGGPAVPDATGGTIYNPLYRSDYLIVDLDGPVADNNEFKQKYLIGQGNGSHANGPLKYLYYRFMITANNGTESPEYEYVSGYAEIDIDRCGLMPGHTRGYIRLRPVSVKMGGAHVNVSPLAYSAWQFSRLNTPKKAFNQPEYGEPGIRQFIDIIGSANIVSQIVQFFQGPNGRMHAQGFGNRMDPSRSWVRLFEPDKNKLGGGNRVKEISIHDGWEAMSPSEPGAIYGQEFSYVNEEGYSSGVAAYEPGAGADENPFRIPLFYNTPKQVLIPQEKHYMEEPFGESFFPSPSVGYSRVTVKDKVYDPAVTLNRTGKTVHEFYTAYDFPTQATYTQLQPEARNSSPLGKLLKVNSRKYMTVSQGYTVTVNDMHGKEKGVYMYAEGEKKPFSYTRYHYRTTDDGRLDNMADVIDEKGDMAVKPIGVETDMVADMREQSTVSECVSVTMNVASMMFGIVGVVVPTVYGSFSKEKTRFRSAVTTKVVSVFGIQDRTETYDKGAKVETRLVAFDAHTGAPLVQELNNEFNDKYYLTDYPAHWVHRGMGQASQNIGYTFTLSHLNGTTGAVTDSYLQPGDEVLPIFGDPYGRTVVPQTGISHTARLWVARDDTDQKMYLIDMNGTKYIPTAGSAGHFRVIRSGYRNQQGTSVGSVTSLYPPIDEATGKLAVGQSIRVVAASALEYSEHWKTERGLQKMTCVETIKHPKAEAFKGILNYLLKSNGSISVSYPAAYPVPQQYAEGLPYLAGACGPGSVSYSGTVQPCYNLDYQIANEPYYGDYFIPGNQYSYLSFTFYVNGVNCCDVAWMYSITPCPAFGTGSWTHISRFTGYDLVDAHRIILRALMDDNSERDFFVYSPSDCMKIDMDEVRTECKPAMLCSYEKGDAINPYLYGILGNWRAKGDYFFMGDRNNMSAATAENLRTDGYLPGFKTFWRPPIAAEAAWQRNIPEPDLGRYENWNRKTEMTVYSPYGFDLENKNPLPAYSSAQYGYLNLLPVAVAGNAMQKEIGYDGFEDHYPALPRPECKKEHFWFEGKAGSLSDKYAHTGRYSRLVPQGGTESVEFDITPPYGATQTRKVPYVLDANDLLTGFSPNLGQKKRYVLCFWAREDNRNPTVFDYTAVVPSVTVGTGSVVVPGSLKKSKIISDWQRYELLFDMAASPSAPVLKITIANTGGGDIYVDDIRVHPFDANMKSFVYDKDDYKYRAQLDENNFATFYEYDKSGRLVRTKKETERGIMTLGENRTTNYKR